MNTTPTIDDILEGLIVGLQNEIIPHLSNAKSVATAMMMQSLLQQVRQVLPMMDASLAHEHNEMTRTLRETAALLGDVSGTLAAHKVNIIACTMKTDRDRMALMRFDCELGDPSHLDAVLGRIRSIDGVYESYRVLPGSQGEG